MIKNLNFNRKNSGFTLIELMVVVAIIALIASVIVASLGTARKKSRDSFLKEQANQMRILLEQEYNEKGSYVGLQPVLWVPGTACASLFTSINNSAKAREICNSVVAQGYNPGIGAFFVGNAFDQANKYSIMVALPGKNTYFCIGSNGATSDATDTTGNYPGDPIQWKRPGCYADPQL